MLESQNSKFKRQNCSSKLKGILTKDKRRGEGEIQIEKSDFFGYNHEVKKVLSVYCFLFYRPIAQGLEHRSYKAGVAGSNPAGPTIGKLEIFLTANS
ncbi:MAG: hypothetical protein UU65_C0002G0075 [candidate division CPR2 bacterium GW2011_GWC1_41_48]|uniref:Uncharacterized protein n=1 Tax=candidate division CPR2 bacterium GW2011_GWC1_41_48 TaxID=1618344 RepID=A0A0G0WB52_UNCC2|nr:MAG: hypothetical protein UT47_C0002G0229 [candidate division CPR2 bacterium GW2011_GWC2_39_35]KKR28330.1 MAG: hypothetical protein UT59_C0030G0005 [candidate division CPR2 bacterium GW2011_GWD1_39_7]KKR29087.1 MAG: hypothetical protein UT60_C0007G0032 [candidate division CPR2 bacterium GW2011_GWD2_39_7]KKS09297.1 MAG: hypothetical protein UU65_C0002G0075 [candidate division CPR2 bacterium GW2011_GWC1_41_48]